MKLKVGDLVISRCTSAIRLYNVDSPCGFGGDDDYDKPHEKITDQDILLLVSNPVKKVYDHDEDDGLSLVSTYHIKVMKSDGTFGWAETEWLKKIVTQ